MDDYAEVWVNGAIPRRSGYLSPATIQGVNMPNRVVLKDAVKAGDQFQIAVFGERTDLGRAGEHGMFRQGPIEFYK